MDADLKRESSDLHELVAARVGECLECVHVAERLNAGVDGRYSQVHRDFDWAVLKGRISTEHAMLMGHSMGSITALSTVAVTERFDGRIAVPLSTLPVAFCLDGLLWPMFANDEAVLRRLLANATPCIAINCTGNSRFHNWPRNKARRQRLLQDKKHYYELFIRCSSANEVYQTCSQTEHSAFADPNHWKTSLPWRLSFGRLAGRTCFELVAELALSYAQLRTAHSHDEINSQRLWPTHATRKKYANTFTVTECVV